MIKSVPQARHWWTIRARAIEVAVRALPAYLLQQRWYPAKDAGLPTVTLSRLIQLECPGGPAAIAIWTATPPGGAPLRLFLPLAIFSQRDIEPSDARVIGPLDAESVVADAFASDSFVRSFVDLMLHPTLQERELQTGRTARAAPFDILPASQWQISRSFTYAAESVKREGPESSSAANRAVQLDRWLEAASRVYLESYLKHTAQGLVEPIDVFNATTIVQFFVLQKALYEVLYEAANRPTWISIPLTAVMRLLDEVKSSATRHQSGA
jgi:hypothetical protein